MVLPDFDEQEDEEEDDRADHRVREAPHVAEDLTQNHQRLQQGPAAEHSQTVLGLWTDGQQQTRQAARHAGRQRERDRQIDRRTQTDINIIIPTALYL